MKIISYKLLITALILSTVINILSITNIVPDLISRIAFIVVMVCCLIANFPNLWIHNKDKKTSNNSHINQTFGNMKPLYLYLYILLFIFWIITYAVAIFRS